jgi:hypothetical protein
VRAIRKQMVPEVQPAHQVHQAVRRIQ